MLKIFYVLIFYCQSFMKIQYFILGIIPLILAACNCNHIECETGPPQLEVQLTDSIGTDPLAAGTLLLKDIELYNVNKSEPAFTVYYNGIISFSLDEVTAKYILKIENKPRDTFDISIMLTESGCCSSFNVTKVSKNGVSLSFRPLRVSY